MFQIVKIWVAYVDVAEAAGVFVSFIPFRKLGHCGKLHWIYLESFEMRWWRSVGPIV